MAIGVYTDTNTFQTGKLSHRETGTTVADYNGANCHDVATTVVQSCVDPRRVACVVRKAVA